MGVPYHGPGKIHELFTIDNIESPVIQLKTITYK